ncbi:hypothetical protein V1264_008052 [Littorina saxatilis]|uniref:Uncharacterized protein n=1 Tax=Littorina saxatilis TaxID=31220 RepID=A0AAN9ASR0_9CAEN
MPQKSIETSKTHARREPVMNIPSRTKIARGCCNYNFEELCRDVQQLPEPWCLAKNEENLVKVVVLEPGGQLG